jgi:exopolyphosphatase / guanosine-5'-triphosphate,3'-diphosphate pyrophosphatase
VVATSAVREAANADAFVDRVFMATGLDVEVIHTSEESRLTVSAVRAAVGKGHGVDRGYTLIVEVGGGSTLLTVLEKGQIALAQALPLGSIRLPETLATASAAPERAAELLRNQIAHTVTTLQPGLPLGKVRTMIAVGSDARFAAGQAGKPTPTKDLLRIDRAAFDRLVRKCVRCSADDLVKQYGLPFAEAETINPALLVHQEMLHATRAGEMLVPPVAMRDGLLLDLARSVTGQEDPTLSQGVIHAAEGIAAKYQVDLKHARNVADLAAQLFDDLKAEHGLKPRQRILLYVAGLLHEVGTYVGSRSHHKHSYYLIANSEIFGLAREEIAVVAAVARYHRRSTPKPAHLEYMSLPQESRMVVSKLAALLRVADALDRSHGQQVRDIRCECRDEELIITVGGASDLTLERHALVQKADLFEDIYGLKVRLEEGRTAGMAERRAEAIE